MENKPVSITPSDVNNGTTDNCDVPQISISQSTFNYPGSYTVTLTATDGSGNTSTCLAGVTVQQWRTWYADWDRDGYGNPANSMQSKEVQPVGYVLNSGDCDDSDLYTHPGAQEQCDGKDNNCDGQIDEGIAARIYYRDDDGDGYGDAAKALPACSIPAGYSNIGTDCNDADKSIYPAAPELCDGKDNNCNGQIDENISNLTYYRDADGDGYGNPAIYLQSCKPPAGYVNNNWDCNDNDAALNAPLTYFVDVDRDGYGSSATAQLCTTTPPAGYSARTGDCNDNDPAINPGVPDECDGKDNNCSGDADENCPAGPTVYMANDILNVSEAAGSASVAVMLSKAPALGKTITVSYATVNGTATAVKDYTARAGTLSFSGSQTIQWVNIPLVNDTRKEPDEYFNVQLSSASGATLDRYQTQVVILNDDRNVRHSTLTVSVIPNPSSQYFTLYIESTNNNPVDIIISDAQGRIKETIRGAAANGVTQLGQAYTPGLYYTEVIQGKERVIVQMIKL